MTQQEMVAIFRHTGDYGIFEIDGARWMVTYHFMRRLDFDLEIEASGDMGRMTAEKAKASLGRNMQNKTASVVFGNWAKSTAFGWRLNLKTGTAIAAPYFYLFEDCELSQQRKPIDTPTSSIVAMKDGKIVGVLMPLMRGESELAEKPTLYEALDRIASQHNDWFGISPKEAKRREIAELSNNLRGIQEEILSKALEIVDLENERDMLRIDAAKIEARLKELKGEKG